jgi:hypothetical protein
VIDVAKPLGIEVHDHLIVGRDGPAGRRCTGQQNRARIMAKRAKGSMGN